MSKSSDSHEVTSRALRRSFQPIVISGCFFIFAMLVSASAIWYAERGVRFDNSTMTWYTAEEEKSKFQNIFDALYWSVTTISSTGYGDKVPITVAGKIISCVTMLAAILAIAIPTSILGTMFLNELSQFERKQERLRYQRVISKRALDAVQPEEIVDYKLRSQYLSAENDKLLETVAEIQEKLFELCPTGFYKKYQSSQKMVRQLKGTVQDLRQQVKTLQGQLRRVGRISVAGRDIQYPSKDTRTASLAAQAKNGSFLRKLAVKRRATSDSLDKASGTSETAPNVTDVKEIEEHSETPLQSKLVESLHSISSIVSSRTTRRGSVPARMDPDLLTPSKISNGHLGDGAFSSSLLSTIPSSPTTDGESSRNHLDSRKSLNTSPTSPSIEAVRKLLLPTIDLSSQKQDLHSALVDHGLTATTADGKQRG